MVFLEKLNPVANQKTDSEAPDFETALSKLESIVTKMEAGELTLEQALKHFEQGIALARECQQALGKAEQRIQALIAENNQPLEPSNEGLDN